MASIAAPRVWPGFDLGGFLTDDAELMADVKESVVSHLVGVHYYKAVNDVTASHSQFSKPAGMPSSAWRVVDFNDDDAVAQADFIEFRIAPADGYDW